jgi:uncharacterized membrane protein YfcA
VTPFLLIAEGLWTALWLAGLLPVISTHSPAVVAVITARAIVGVGQIMSGRWLLARRSGAPRLAQVVVVASAVLLGVELGARMSPSNLDPTFRWPVIALYGIYAAILVWLLQRRRS